MQKKVFVESVIEIVSKINPSALVEVLNRGSQVGTIDVLAVILEMKKAYDFLDENSREYEILGLLEADKLFSSLAIARVISILSNSATSLANLTSNQDFNKYYMFANTLIELETIVLGRFDEHNLYGLTSIDLVKKGYVSLELISSGDIPLSKFSLIATNLDRILELFKRIVSHTEPKQASQEILVKAVDSGSDINFIIKCGTQIARLFYGTFKSIYEFRVSTKHASWKKCIEAIDDSLNIHKKIKEAVEAGTIDSSTADSYKQAINACLVKIVPSVAPTGLLDQPRTPTSSLRKELEKGNNIKKLSSSKDE